MSNSPLKQKKGISVAGFNITNPQGSKKSQIVHDAVSTFDFNSDNKISFLEGAAGVATSILGGTVVKNIATKASKYLPKITNKLLNINKSTKPLAARFPNAVNSWKSSASTINSNKNIINANTSKKVVDNKMVESGIKKDYSYTSKKDVGYNRTGQAGDFKTNKKGNITFKPKKVDDPYYRKTISNKKIEGDWRSELWSRYNN